MNKDDIFDIERRALIIKYIFFGFMFYFKVIFKGKVGPEDICQ